MKEKEFNLSEKELLSSIPHNVIFKSKSGKKMIVEARKGGQPLYKRKDVKEFIKRLKDELFKESFQRGLPLNDGSLDRLPLQFINEEIDKLAGEKLQ